MDAGIAAVIEAAREGDAIITLGAGSISQAGGAILEHLRRGTGRSGCRQRRSLPAIQPRQGPPQDPVSRPRIEDANGALLPPRAGSPGRLRPRWR